MLGHAILDLFLACPVSVLRLHHPETKKAMSVAPLLVYVLIGSNHFKHSEALTVQLDISKAKQIAERLEPDKPFKWRDFEHGAYIEGGHLDGPRYSYSIEPFEVRI